MTTTSVGGTSRVVVFDASSGSQVKVGDTLNPPKGDETANIVFEHATKVNDFLRTKFGRDGWDGKGATLDVVIHQADDKGNALNNAYWTSEDRQIRFGDGDGKLFTPLGNGLDVVAHETMHAVIDSEVHLKYEGQQGAIHESFSDVFAALVDPDDWTIGEDVFTPGRPNDAIRDLTRPRFRHTSALIPDAELGVHELSGIPSLAAIRVAEAVGREKMGSIWYSALTEHLKAQSGFAGAARATLTAAQTLFGDNSTELNAVRDAWTAVGVNPRWKASPTTTASAS